MGIGNYGEREAAVHIDLPSFNNVSLKFDGLIQKRDGFIENPLDGEKDFGAHNRRGLHVAALWEPSPFFSAQYGFDISRDATTPLYMQISKAGTLPLAPLTKIQPDRATVANYGVPMPWSIGESHGHLLQLNWEVSQALQVKSISSYRKLEQSQFDPGTNFSVYAPNANFSRESQAFFNQDQYSQEI